MTEPTEPLFEIRTSLGFVVRSTPSYWEFIERKHPEVRGRLPDVQRCLESPEQVRRSRQDYAVYLFYRLVTPHYLCVVVKRLNRDGFVVTCYLTDAIKEGECIWPTSV